MYKNQKQLRQSTKITLLDIVDMRICLMLKQFKQPNVGNSMTGYFLSPIELTSLLFSYSLSYFQR